jgi:hypothetical protein
MRASSRALVSWAASPPSNNIIEAGLTVYVPWQPKQGPIYQRSRIAELAERIDRRAQQGFIVHLKPQTAHAVAMTMRLYAEGHPDPRQSHPHHVEDWTTEPHEILAYYTSATPAVGAWQHYAPQRPRGPHHGYVGRMDDPKQSAGPRVKPRWSDKLARTVRDARDGVTLRTGADARRYMTELPEARARRSQWQSAASLRLVRGASGSRSRKLSARGAGRMAIATG